MILNGIDFQELNFFNLSDLLTLIDNDVDTLKVLLEEFIEVAPIDIQELGDAIKNKNYEAIAAKAHKLKSTFKYFGIITATKLAEIEELAKNENDMTQILSMFDSILVDFQGALNEAKKIIS